ncbi:MAG: hypothetical protein ACLGI2_07455 [Acidimicrobiia bacterium]
MRRPAAVAAVGVALALLAGCGDGDGDGDGGSDQPAGGYREAAAALCTARDQARADLNKARATFYDRSHDALHDISRDLDPVDRAASGRLLEAKQRVESALDADPPPAGLVADLQELADVTRAGLARLSVDVPPCA